MAERPPQRQSSTSSHRSLTHPTNPDVFSDEYSLESLGVADGFQPPNRIPNALPTIVTPVTTNTSPRSTTTQPIRHPSIEKAKRTSQGFPGHGRGNSFSLRYDALQSRIPRRTPSATSTSEMSDFAPMSNRPASALSSYAIPRSQSPYRGASGPSHPYRMYPQDIPGNRSSIATNSTVRIPDRPYTGPDAPQHPYGMYPQNTVHDGEVSPLEDAAPPIPLGFPGLGQQYRRRLGPEGEDADDIIGPDGHTEQLPPYTRFANNVPPKVQREEATDGIAISHYEPSVSQETLAITQSRDSVARDPFTDDSAVQLNPPAEDSAGEADASGAAKEKWAAKGKKRTCGGRIPVWAIVLIALLLIILGAVLGGVITRMVVNQKRKEFSHSKPTETQAVENQNPQAVSGTPTVTITSIVDASVLPSMPVNVPPLPTGNFEFSLQAPTIWSHGCISNNSMNTAWTCVPYGRLGFNVASAGGSSFDLTMPSQVPSFGNQMFYGSRPPSIDSASLVGAAFDLNDQSRGPAYWYQHIYDKLVVVSEDGFQGTPSYRRSIEGLTLEAREGWSRDSQSVKADEKPWFCYWNGTVLEVFVYINLNTSSSQPTAASPSMSSASAAAPSSYPTGPLTPLYPKVVKVEERRNASNTIPPYCQQMVVGSDGVTVTPNLDPLSQQPVIVHFNETEIAPPPASTAPVGNRKRSDRAEGTILQSINQRDIESECECQWLND